MKTFYLIRHAESDVLNSVSDFDRPLNNKGLSDAALVSEKVFKENFKPTLIYCSPAQRTETTSTYFIKNSICVFDDKIYEASLQDLKSLISSFPNKHQEIALIGHNPSISFLANYLTGNNIKAATPCTVIKINFDIENWAEITEGSGTQEFYISPESL